MGHCGVGLEGYSLSYFLSCLCFLIHLDVSKQLHSCSQARSHSNLMPHPHTQWTVPRKHELGYNPFEFTVTRMLVALSWHLAPTWMLDLQKVLSLELTREKYDLGLRSRSNLSVTQIRHCSFPEVLGSRGEDSEGIMMELRR